MDRDNGEFFTSINTVSKDLGIPAHTLRYWEKQFPSVVRPMTGAGGRRYYRTEMVARLRTIRDLLYSRGMTIAGVKKMIHTGDFAVDESIMPVASIMPRATQSRNVIEPISSSASIDMTKVDLAIGLLQKAKDLLE